MTDQQLPSGWFPDPLGRYEHRWFNGATWTSDVASNGQRFVDPLGIAPSPYGGAQPGGQHSGNRSATVALVCGLVGVVVAWIPLAVVAGIVLAILAVVFGVKGLRRSRENGEGRGRAITGLVSGGVALALSIVGIVLTVGLFREVIAFIEPGPRFVDEIECTVDGREATVTGRLTNLDDQDRDYTLFATVDGRTRYVEIDDVGPGEAAEWIVRVEGDFASGATCDADVVVNGPFPYGIETDPYRD